MLNWKTSLMDKYINKRTSFVHDHQPLWWRRIDFISSSSFCSQSVLKGFLRELPGVRKIPERFSLRLYRLQLTAKFMKSRHKSVNLWKWSMLLLSVEHGEGGWSSGLTHSYWWHKLTGRGFWDVQTLKWVHETIRKL